jgi:hypothetical protein
MAELNEQFIQECLDRHPYNTDMSKLILEIAQGANVTETLLSRVSRSDIIEWLGYEIQILLEPAVKPPIEERNSAELLLGYLEKTKADGSPGLVIDVEREAVEELGVGPKYYQVFYVTIRYEGAELAEPAPDSEGEYKDGKWVAEPAKWPALLEGLMPLPELVSEEPEVEVEEEEVDQPGEHEQREQAVLLEIERGTAGGTLERADEGTTDMRRPEPSRTPELFR